MRVNFTRRSAKWCWFAGAALSCSTLLSVATVATSTPPRRATVLILNLVGLAHPASAAITRELISQLEDNRDYQVEFYIESLDSTLFGEKGQRGAGSTPVFVVLGHEGCGAVKAALSSKLHDVGHQFPIQILVDNMLPGLSSLSAELSEEAQLADAVEANVRWSMHQLAESSEGQAAIREDRAKLVGAVYEIATGRVRYLPENP